MQDFRLMRKGKNFKKNQEIIRLNQTGFTLIEVLIMVVILALLIITLLFFFQRHLMRSRDATRKTDIDKIRIAFEEYYNDKRCYPSPHYLMNCGSTLLTPYLKEIPCDPLTKQPYFYQSYDGDYCQGYRLLTQLEIDTDSDIATVGCDPVAGCGGEDGEDYNWGMSTGDLTTGIWETGGSGESGEEERANYCTPIYGGGYECQELSYSDRWEYFEIREGDSCTSYINESECNVSCVVNGGMEPGVACVCLPGSDYLGCQ